MEVRWSPSAAEDLEHIFRRIERDDPMAARQVVSTIYSRCASLDFPHSGRPGRTKGRKELVFTPLPYIAVYRIKEGAVEISGIYHGAQNWP